MIFAVKASIHHRKLIKCLKWDNLPILEKHQLILNLVAAIGTGRLGGATFTAVQHPHFLSAVHNVWKLRRELFGFGERNVVLISYVNVAAVVGLCVCRAWRKCCVEGNTCRSSLSSGTKMAFPDHVHRELYGVVHQVTYSDVHDRMMPVFNYAHRFLQFPGIVWGYIALFFFLFFCGPLPTVRNAAAIKFNVC